VTDSEPDLGQSVTVRWRAVVEKCNESSSYIKWRKTLHRMSNQKPPKKGTYTSSLKHSTVIVLWVMDADHET
jgi:hypothetical protein